MSIDNDAPSPRASISVAMIVRDESAHLAECLSCIAPLADEICVVDTGSMDDTVSIARQYGCHVAHFPWSNDFSAARNVSMDACRGDWIFVLDADERIAPEDLERIRGLMAAGPSACYRMITRNYTNTTNLSDFVSCGPEDPWARGFAGWYPSGKVRFFPNGVGARFTGVVHELVNPSLEAAGIEIRTSEIPVHHYPLIRPEAQLRQKQQMYLELGLEKTRQSPEDARAHAELAVQYVEMGDIHNAVRAYRAAVRLEPENALWIKDLGGSLLMMGRTDDAILALGLALKRKPELADAWRNLGIAHASRSAWPEALDCFLRLKGLIPEDGESRRYLALALEGTGRRGEAALEAWEALRRRPESGEAGALYGRLMRGLDKTEAARSRLDTLEVSCGAMPGINEARSALDR